ncbi:DUF2079 domain-containing protein [Leptospira kemamanensis]|uniref:DUF2079 domain-containing protein n=1 Tax=Leptospira kemamanensis TaxID=2484942 RepID=A0A4R9JTI8_9LEPT|nr:DUF2079 domain-containing protein [Leptospira kemamanensis]TGL56061.1 DUF2079 domain-containing protein [Leptospira kemamanensis]
MVYLFFLSSLITSFLFVSPKHFHAPFQKGVSLFFLGLFVYSVWKNKKESPNSKSFSKFFSLQTHNDLLPYFVWVSGLCFLLASSYHAYHLTQFFVNSFLFHDADYIGISDVLLSFAKGYGFQSHYYSDTVNGSYLNHHFAPGMAFLSPFVKWIPNRYGLAVGVFLCYQLTTILWLTWAYFVSQKNKSSIDLKFLVIWVVLTNQLYLYRIGSSYHFEILVVFFGCFFFYQWERCKTILVDGKTKFTKQLLLLGLSLILFLIQKEDIGIYLCLFFLPVIITSLYQVYRAYRENRFLTSTSQRKVFSLFGILLITVLYLGFVFFLFPILNGSHSILSWSQVLRQEYHASFKQVTSVSKSIQIYLELLTSGGLGMIQLIPELLGISLIYLMHVLSTRPWHHEVYSYYSYSLLPFLLYSGILWLKSEKQISLPLVYLILACLFWKNSMDQNFPLVTQSKEHWYDSKVQAEVKEDLPYANGILQTEAEKESTHSANKRKEQIVFSQYNLSFFINDKVTLYPLEKLQNGKEICDQTKLCYVVLAPEFTDTILWPKQRILDTFAEAKTRNHQKIWQGKQIEVWKLKK